MPKDHKEWLLQADYDMDTADYMLKGGRRVYGMFFCHLSIEKALKGLYHFRLGELPPKTHNLVLLLKAIGEMPPAPMMEFITQINEAHVAASYPDELQRFHAQYSKQNVATILKKGRKVLEWTKKQFSE